MTVDGLEKSPIGSVVEDRRFATVNRQLPTRPKSGGPPASKECAISVHCRQTYALSLPRLLHRWRERLNKSFSSQIYSKRDANGTPRSYRRLSGHPGISIAKPAAAPLQSIWLSDAELCRRAHRITADVSSRCVSGAGLERSSAMHKEYPAVEADYGARQSKPRSRQGKNR